MTRLSHDDLGEGPAVVLLHGFPLDRSMWRAQIDRLSSTYRVIAPDLPGHGESPVLGVTPTMESMAEAVVALLDSLGIAEPVVLGGLSMGGYVALAALANHPGRFRALMLLDTRATADTPEAAANRESLARKVEEAGDARLVADAMRPKLFAPSTIEQAPELVESTVSVMSRAPAAGVAGALRAMASRPDRTKTLRDSGLPTLVLVGAEDVITPPDEMKAMANLLPIAQFQIIPGAGHLAPLERPDECNIAMLAFLDSLPGSGDQGAPGPCVPPSPGP